MNPLRRLWLGAVLLAASMVFGTVGYIVLGFSVLDAMYQTVTTITTVGFREVEPLSAVGKVFTMVVILFGVGTALYTFSVLIEALVEGQIGEQFGRRRMERTIESMKDHVIVCGWGRVGRAMAQFVAGAGRDVVVIDTDGERLKSCPYPSIHGDATDDEVLQAAGIRRARALAAAINTDAANVYVTISGRAISDHLFIVARARIDASVDKLLRAGANRVVNPQSIGGARMAAFALQPHVAEFLDVVMHDGSLEFRIEEVQVPEWSGLAGSSLRDAHLRDRTGALVLAMRDQRGTFTTNPSPESRIEPGQVLIAIGTSEQLAALTEAVRK